jgi:oligosaccharide repeat unit polymerase
MSYDFSGFAAVTSFALFLTSLWFFFRKQTISHPFLLLMLTQGFPFLITIIDFNNRSTTFSIKTLLILISSYLAFGLGCLSSRSRNHSWKFAPLNTRKLEIATFTLLTIAFTSIIGRMVLIGGIPLFSSNPDDMRSKFIGDIVSIWATSQAVSSVSLWIVFVVEKDWRSSNFKWMTLLACSVIVLYFLTGNRGNVIVWATFGVIYPMLRKGKLPLIRIASAILAILLVFTAVGYLRYGKMVSSATSAIKMEDLVEIGNAMLLKGISDYAGNAFWNLDYALEQEEKGEVVTPTFGLSAFSGILHMLKNNGSIEHGYNWDSSLNESIKKVPGLNSTTYHWAFYKDFGLIGLLLFNYIAGFLLRHFYRMAWESRNPAICARYAAWIYFLVIGFNISPFIIPFVICGTVGIEIALYFAREKSRLI